MTDALYFESPGPRLAFEILIFRFSNGITLPLWVNLN